MTAIRVTDDTSRAEIAEALVHANAAAKRKPRVVGDEKIPTAWDHCHEILDALLEDWENAPA